MMDPKVALDKLSGFQTPTEIANFLKEEGIVGLASMGARCPVSNYLYRETGKRIFICCGDDQRMATAVHSSVDDSKVVLEPIRLNPQEFDEELSDVVTRFVENFDSGYYGFLEQRGKS